MSFAAATEPSELDHDHRPDGRDMSSQEGASSGPIAPENTGEAPVGGQAPAELSDELIALARAAAIEDAGDPNQVGDYLDATREDEIAVTAAFVATDRGYRGWHWSVTLAVVDPARPTISEVVLLPGEQALLAPPWLPWDQRIQAGDVGVGDLLPTAPDDIRLVPGYVDSDDPDLKELEYEFGFGRERVLSREGRDEAAQRWHDGPFGPDDIIAQQAPAHCVTCGFYVPLTGLLGMALGACANEYSPADGRVVDAEYGCGAHSATVIDAPLMSASTDTVVDELTLEVHLHLQSRVNPESIDLTESDDYATGPDLPAVGVDPAPVDSAPVDQARVDQVPVDQAPADSVPVDASSADEAPADGALADPAMPEQVPAGAVPADSAPAGDLADEAPADTIAVESAVAGEPAPVGVLPLDDDRTTTGGVNGEQPITVAPEPDSVEETSSDDALGVDEQHTSTS